VIVHELAHLMHHNHGPEFFEVLDQEVPRWTEHKHMLDGMVERVTNEKALSVPGYGFQQPTQIKDVTSRFGLPPSDLWQAVSET